jgi:hypothetical protein
MPISAQDSRRKHVRGACWRRARRRCCAEAAFHTTLGLVRMIYRRIGAHYHWAADNERDRVRHRRSDTSAQRDRRATKRLQKGA